MKKNLSKVLLTFSTMAILFGFAGPSLHHNLDPLYAFKVDIDVH
ncbi:hypothetical protein GCM10007190_08050 [Macrococcus hajekii]|nr:hypothetical protein GCM10007190_08050 [Macrococcus hajekii]